MEQPTDGQVLDAARILYSSNPNIGRAKALATLKTENNWDLGNKRFKKLIDASDIAQSIAGAQEDTAGGAQQRPDATKDALPPIPLPKDAHAALVRYMETSRRCFRIYGRGEYDYGVSPNMDQQLLIGICHDRLLKLGAPGPWDEKTKILIAGSSEMYTIWNYWWAAGRKVCLTEEDIGRQLEAEYGVDPRPWLPVLSKAQLLQRKAMFKAKSLELKRAMLKSDPEAQKVIPVDSKGEPVWDEKIHGEYVVQVVKVSKEDGVTEYGTVA
ncbi:uncharacterized protein CC84DRAFT_1213256 [Paraphaeosphaeria sporulosa]|uniref:Uncharacterized protein n=1 Tax=Paraphaeosphaeria sporulosa TaxID=1460663 RepID=A0A177CT07_9PLEO|nr:uncharacterized protein CC84DRAFT_1213256 [Paraphaeosphaeria sporulosa]OAG09879.1 hypothetical protein CC84DRAFT_1213256 [Paraphaeosphaeria sporulosa]